MKTDLTINGLSKYSYIEYLRIDYCKYSLHAGIRGPHCFLLAVDFQEVFGSGTAVELVDVLSDDRDLTSLFAQSLLTLGNGQVGGVGVFCEHDLAAVVVKLPNAGGIPGEGLWGGKFLQDENMRNGY